MDNIQFSWTLSLGHLVNLFAIFVSGLGAFFMLRYNVQAIGVKVTDIENTLLKFETALAKQTDILIAIARQDEQIKSLNESIRSLKQHSR